MTMARSNQIMAGTDVYGSDDHKVGTVADVGQNYILVQKGFLFTKDLYLPTSTVARVDADWVHLKVTKDRAETVAAPELPPEGDPWYGTMASAANHSTTGMTGTTTTTTTDASMTTNRTAMSTTPVAATTTTTAERLLVLTGDETLTLPLVAETLAAEAVWRDAGIVRLRLHGEEFAQTIRTETIHEELYTEQVAVGRVLAEGEVVEPRQEGDVYILPVIREEAVVVKRRILDHELRVTKRAVTETQTVEAILRRTRATVDAGDLSARTHVHGTVVTDEAHETDRRR